LIATHYERLGVAANASAAEIRAAYHRLARQLHPDIASRAGVGATATSDMAGINEAWRVLSDPGRRAMYDATIRSHRASSAPAGDWESRLSRAWADADDTEDEDDPADFVPSTLWQRRIPIWTMVLLGTLAAIFFVTAYAGSGRIGTKLPRAPAVDGLLTAGSCVRLASGGLAEETECTMPNDGAVVALIQYDGRCPAGSSGYRRRDGVAGYACVTHN
jgi:molecular chaperone DnaJ